MSVSTAKRAANRRLQAALLEWYRASRRDLPWRRSADPYAIWVSEIMLQQTRVAAVIDYFERFMREFPTVEALAAAPEERVLAAWSGLGYYRRARMLHKAAKKIAEELDGKLPRDSAGLRELPGIGRYTAAAIASIAFGEALAVVDGNVERVLERLDGESRTAEAVWSRAQKLLAIEAPGDWNQAVMELGATVCTPVAPRCDVCPVRPWCKAPGEDVRRPQAPRKKKSKCYGFVRRGKRVYLVQRPATATLMPGMWELPEVEGGEVLSRMKHSITDSDYDIMVVTAKLVDVPRGGRWFYEEELTSVPLTGLARKALRKLASTNDAKSTRRK